LAKVEKNVEEIGIFSNAAARLSESRSWRALVAVCGLLYLAFAFARIRIWQHHVAFQQAKFELIGNAARASFLHPVLGLEASILSQ
jgi:hypothetical protein